MMPRAILLLSAALVCLPVPCLGQAEEPELLGDLARAALIPSGLSFEPSGGTNVLLEGERLPVPRNPVSVWRPTLEGALGGFAAAKWFPSKRVCVSVGASGERQAIGVRPSAVDEVALALGIPEGALTPSETLILRAGQGQRLFVVEQADVGEWMFEALKRAAKRRSSLVWLDPPLQTDETELVLKTKDGKSIVLPARVEGAGAPKLPKAGAQWRIKGEPGGIPFDIGARFHKVLLLLSYSEGPVELREVEIVRNSPEWSSRSFRAALLEGHLVGQGDRWFGRTQPFTIDYRVRVRADVDGCALSIVVDPKPTRPRLSSVPHPVEQSRVERVVLIEPSRERVVLGYAGPPDCASR